MAVRRSRRRSTAPQTYDPDAEAAKPQFASTTDTGKASLRRNYVGKASMLKTLRASDFEEKEQHDGNELRAEVHHDYNEGHLADKAAHTHRAVPHKKKAAPKKSAKKSPSPAPKSRSPSPAPKRKSGSPSPAPKRKSGSPSPAPKRKSGSPSPAPKRKSRSPSPAPEPQPEEEPPVEEEGKAAEQDAAAEAETAPSDHSNAWMIERIVLLIVIAIAMYLAGEYVQDYMKEMKDTETDTGGDATDTGGDP